MMNSRPAVCRRRTFIESEARFTLALADTLFENFILLPELQNFPLESEYFILSPTSLNLFNSFIS